MSQPGSAPLLKATLFINTKPFVAKKPRHGKDFFVRCPLCATDNIVSLMKAKKIMENQEKSLAEVIEMAEGSTSDEVHVGGDVNQEHHFVFKCAVCNKPSLVQFEKLVKGVTKVEQRAAAKAAEAEAKGKVV